MAIKTGGDIFNREQAEVLLYPAKGLAGGGQLEVRMEISPDHPDPDIRSVARRVKFFNLESGHKEWTEVAKKNEDLAVGFAEENRKQTAHEFYLRAADFYRRAVVYMAENDPRMLPTFKKLEENFVTAWSLVKAPFERVEIPYEGRSCLPYSGSDAESPGRGCPPSTIMAARTAFYSAAKTAVPVSTCAAVCLSSTSTDPGMAPHCATISSMRLPIPSALPKQ